MAVWNQVQHSTGHTSSQFLVKVTRQHILYCDTAQTAYGVLWHCTGCIWCTVTAQTAYGVLWHCTDCIWCTVTLHRLHMVYCDTAQTAYGVLWQCTDCIWCTVTLNRLHMVYCDTEQTTYGVLWHWTDYIWHTVTLHRLHMVYCDSAQTSPRCPLLSEVIQFYGTCIKVMSVITIRTVQPSLCWFPQNSQMVNNILYFYYWYFVSSWTKQAFYIENRFWSSGQFYWFQFSTNFKTALYSNMMRNPKVCAVPQSLTNAHIKDTHYAPTM
jgi:hypothetical protein